MRVLFFIAAVFITSFSFAQNDSIHIGRRLDTTIVRYFFSNSDYFDKRRTATVISTEALLATGSLAWLHQVWYKNYSTGKFHFFNDNPEWLQMDKCGHVLTCYTTGRICFDLLNWSGVNEKKTTWYGGLTGFTYMTIIELFDGFSSGWGFSWGDMAANTIGGGMFIGQQLGWHQQRITLKFGFQKSNYAQYRPSELGSSNGEQLIKDYNGQTYWLSVNIASFLNENSKFPKWLDIALGYGADGMIGGRSNPPVTNSSGNIVLFERYRQFYISPDIDLWRIKTKSHFLHAIFKTIGFIKFPLPALEFSNSKISGHWIGF